MILLTTPISLLNTSRPTHLGAPPLENSPTLQSKSVLNGKTDGVSPAATALVRSAQERSVVESIATSIRNFFTAAKRESLQEKDTPTGVLASAQSYGTAVSDALKFFALLSNGTAGGAPAGLSRADVFSLLQSGVVAGGAANGRVAAGQASLVDVLSILARTSSENRIDALGRYAQGVAIKQATQSALAEFNALFETNLRGITANGVSGVLLREAGAGSLADFFGLSAAPTASEIGKAPSTAPSGFSQLVGALGAGYSAYELAKNWGATDPISGLSNGAAAGAFLGSKVLSGPGTILGGLLGGVVGLASGLFKKSGKPLEQKERDAVRHMLQKGGFVDRSWGIKLADGTSFDIGKDGGFRIKNLSGGERPMTALDSSNPLAAQVAQLAKPLAQAVAGSNARLQSDFTAIFTNAALSNATSAQDAVRNIQTFYQSFKGMIATE